MNNFRTVKKFLFGYWMALIPTLMFGLLLFRSPYSQRTQIANLEPFPDSIHYLSPALGVLRGQGLYINREGRKLLPGVPPLYSLALVPGLALNQDVRTFYFVNVLLSFLAFYFFYLILSKITKNKFLIFILLCVYVTNYTLYWFPELAMAENLILPLSLIAIYLLITPVTKFRALAIGVLSVSFYATKFASLPLSLAVPLLYFFKVVFSKTKDRTQILARFFLSLFVFGGLYVAYEFLVRKNNLIGGLLGLFWKLFAPKQIISAASGGGATGGFFSLQYFRSNLLAYGRWLIGDPMYVLWKNVNILPKYLALIGWIGLLGTLLTKRRGVSVVLLSLLAFNLFFMLPFYAADGRYLIIAIPILILSLGLGFALIGERLSGSANLLANLVLVGLIGVYAVSSLNRLRFDVMLNLRHSESPWYYISVTTFDTYLKAHRPEFNQEPVVISALPPYLVDFYAREKFILLPLTPGQEFSTHRQEAWGNYDYSNLPGVFVGLFKTGHPVFLTGYGLGNEQYKHEAFDSLMTQFTFRKVEDGCFSLCDIYQMTSASPVKPTIATKVKR